MLDCGEGRHLVEVSLSDQPIQATDRLHLLRQTCFFFFTSVSHYTNSELYHVKLIFVVSNVHSVVYHVLNYDYTSFCFLRGVVI